MRDFLEENVYCGCSRVWMFLSHPKGATAYRFFSGTWEEAKEFQPE
jgi:hypothetical protein